MNYYVEAEGNTPDELLAAFAEEVARLFDLDEKAVLEAIHKTKPKAVAAARMVSVETSFGRRLDIYLPQVQVIKQGTPYDTVVFKGGERIFIKPDTYLFRRWKLYASLNN